MEQRPPSTQSAEHPVALNVLAIAKLERDAVDRQTAVDRVTAAITRVTGSTLFIALHAASFVTWIILNTTRYTFDAYPFQLLNLVVALEAVFLMSVVLMTQNRMAQLADRRTHLDLQVNMLAEQELTAMLRMLYGLCTQAGVSVAIRRSASTVQPNFSATDRIAAHCEGCSCACSKTSRTARSRNSGEYLLARPMGSILSE